MKFKICIVVANYYPKISRELLLGAKIKLKKEKFNNYDIFFSPGVFELPTIIAKKINSYDAFIALGCVIKGKTPHFNFISKTSINGLMQLSIKHKIPIGNGIITCLNKKQALKRSNPNQKNKGGEAANAVISVLRT